MVLHGFVGLIMWAIGSQSPWEEHIVIFRSTDRILNPKTLNPHIPKPKALNIGKTLNPETPIETHIETTYM